MKFQATHKKHTIYLCSAICVIGLLFINSAMARGRFGNTNVNQFAGNSNSSHCLGRKHGPRDPQAILDRLDTNEDGVISLEEFIGPDEHFALIDTDDSGDLSLEELEFAPVIRALDKMDDNADGVISAAEFLGAEEKFDTIDVNDDRVLTSIELEEAVGNIGLGFGNKPQRLIHRLDEDGDGAISQDEFKGSDERFLSKDLDGDGFLTIDELEKSFAGKFLDKSDEDDDGLISPDEFSGTEERFDFLDADLDGFISIAEILSSFD